MKKLLITLSLGVSTLAVAFAQAPAQNLKALIATVQSIVNQLLPLSVGLAVVAFFFGLVMFIIKGREGAEHAKWLQFMGMSILALFVMVSIWGLVAFIGGVFSITSGGTAPAVGIPTGPTN